MSHTPQASHWLRVYKQPTAPMAFQMALTSMVSQQLRSLLEQVCHDYSLDAAEVLPRYLEACLLYTSPSPRD